MQSLYRTVCSGGSLPQSVAEWNDNNLQKPTVTTSATKFQQTFCLQSCKCWENFAPEHVARTVSNNIKRDNRSLRDVLWKLFINLGDQLQQLHNFELLEDRRWIFTIKKGFNIVYDLVSFLLLFDCSLRAVWLPLLLSSLCPSPDAAKRCSNSSSVLPFVSGKTIKK